MNNILGRRSFLKATGTGAAGLIITHNSLAQHAFIKNMKSIDYPFILGAQYYRAPTPEKECWDADHKRMKELGFNMVKYWVQWRWSHRGENLFYFDDLDELMSISAKYGLNVTLNVIFDESPLWLFDRYPDAKQIMNNGSIIEPYTVGHRQIGGHPGPCYNHEGALEERKKFLTETLNHFSKYNHLLMWDVWNEPELSFPQRDGNLDHLACYCKKCESGFQQWLKNKYGTLDALNNIWGRNYESWNQVEMPRNGQTIRDFIDWREFHNDTMTHEAKWRIDLAKRTNPEKIVYLHVVPNTMQPFNAVSTCVDDFEMASMCDVFASTMNGSPVWQTQLVSAANRKICYNVESHINGGATSFHQKIISRNDLLNDWLPQIGSGVKGFLFWQFRPEVLGVESPAWGLVHPDGSDRPVTKAFAEFSSVIKSHAPSILKCSPEPAKIGIWKSRKNEIFHYCINGNLDSLAAGVNGYINTLYWNNYPFRIVSGQMVEEGALEGIEALIMPSCYYVTEAEAKAIDAWVRNGGVLLNEAHLAAYNGTSGRHSRVTPGCGLTTAWDIHEEETTSSYNLKLQQAEKFLGQVTPDVKKMLDDLGTTGAKYFPFKIENADVVGWGATRYASLAGSGFTTEASFDNKPLIVSKKLGKGMIFYAGTNLGEAAPKDNKGLLQILQKVFSFKKMNQILSVSGQEKESLHLDVLYDGKNPKFVVIRNQSKNPQNININLSGRYKGLFSGTLIDNGSVIIEKESCDIFTKN